MLRVAQLEFRLGSNKESLHKAKDQGDCKEPFNQETLRANQDTQPKHSTICKIIMKNALIVVNNNCY